MMRTRIILAASVSGLLASHSVQAADPAPSGAVQGQSVMGDRGRTGPDGWVQAPMTRDESASGTTNGAATGGTHALDAQPNPNVGKTLPPGQDPGTPARTEDHGPGTMDAGSTSKP